jgi:hypothetical protein
MQHLVRCVDRDGVSCRHCWDRYRRSVRAIFSTHTEYIINRNRLARRTWRVYYVCGEHARRYAVRHGCEMPVPPLL